MLVFIGTNWNSFECVRVHEQQLRQLLAKDLILCVASRVYKSVHFRNYSPHFNGDDEGMDEGKCIILEIGSKRSSTADK